MNIVDRFEYPFVEQVTLESGFRYYVCPDTKRRLASVTTILDATSDNNSLAEWKARVGPVKAAQESKFATSLGSLMHEHVEAFIEGRERPSAATPPRIMAKKMADQIIEHAIPHIGEIWGVEKRLYVPGLYAGTSDLIGIYKGKPAIMDHKSSKKIKKKSDIGDYRDQMSAYAIAMTEKYGVAINTAVIFMATRDEKYQAFEFDEEDMIKGKGSFIDRVEQFMKTAPSILREQ